jgi:hypothetical protein
VELSAWLGVGRASPASAGEPVSAQLPGAFPQAPSLRREASPTTEWRALFLLQHHLHNGIVPGLVHLLLKVAESPHSRAEKITEGSGSDCKLQFPGLIGYSFLDFGFNSRSQDAKNRGVTS